MESLCLNSISVRQVKRRTEKPRPYFPGSKSEMLAALFSNFTGIKVNSGIKFQKLIATMEDQQSRSKKQRGTEPQQQKKDFR